MSEQGLTVKELREKLAEYPDDMEVFVDGYEGGVDLLTATHIRKQAIKKNANSEDRIFGRHEIPWNSKDADCEGIVLSR